MESICGVQVILLMRNFLCWFLLIQSIVKSSMSCRTSSKLTIPTCAGPMVGANCRGKVTADVLIGGLYRGNLATRRFRGGESARTQNTRFTQVSAPLYA